MIEAVKACLTLLNKGVNTVMQFLFSSICGDSECRDDRPGVLPHLCHPVQPKADRV